jgi:hypothetical protein
MSPHARSAIMEPSTRIALMDTETWPPSAQPAPTDREHLQNAVPSYCAME